MKKQPSSNRKTFLALAVFCVAALAGYLLYQNSIPESSSEDVVVTIHPASTVLNAGTSIKYYEDRLRKAPGDASSQLALAQLYLQHARATHQEALYLPKADELLSQVISRSPDHYQALALKASMYNVLHQFEKARDITETLISRESDHAYVYGILVDALVELGEYEAAVQACDKMSSLRPGIASYARAAYLRELHGDTAGAIKAMELAASSGVAGDENRSWALYQLGQLYLGQNDIDAAEALFNGILDEHPGYAYAIGGLAQVNLQRGDYGEALSMFDRAYASLPGDAFLEGKLEVYTIMQHEEGIAQLSVQLERSLKDAEAMGENVRMEYADYLADQNRDLNTALELAEAEYNRRPGHLHALETYAWALHKMGRSDEAIPYIEQAMRLETGDAMVHFRAGHIYSAAGRLSEAKHNFEAAIEGHLHIESISSAKEVKEQLQKMRL